MAPNHRIKIQQYQHPLHKNLDIAGIHLRIRKWQEEHGQNIFTDLNSSQEELSSIYNSYIIHGGNFFIAFGDDRNNVLGFIGIKNRGKGIGVIKRLAVVPEAQRTGIGKEMLKTLITWSMKSKFKKLTLSTGKNENAINLYKQCGFIGVGFDELAQDYLMELDLSGSVFSGQQKNP